MKNINSKIDTFMLDLDYSASLCLSMIGKEFDYNFKSDLYFCKGGTTVTKLPSQQELFQYLSNKDVDFYSYYPIFREKILGKLQGLNIDLSIRHSRLLEILLPDYDITYFDTHLCSTCYSWVDKKDYYSKNKNLPIINRCNKCTNKVVKIFSEENPEYLGKKLNTNRVNEIKRFQNCKYIDLISDENKNKINSIYTKSVEMRLEGFNSSVDHIIPIKGINICGLHLPDNLRILDRSENTSKGNRISEKELREEEKRIMRYNE